MHKEEVDKSWWSITKCGIQEQWKQNRMLRWDICLVCFY